MAKLSEVLTHVKEANDRSDTSVRTANADGLKAALHSAITETATSEKVASAPSPMKDLEKLASDVVNAEQAALVKEANWYGAAVADGFMARIAQYNEAATKLASQEQVKAASAPMVPDSFEKFASENPELVKQAAEVGYAKTAEQLEYLNKLAYEKGQEDAVQVVHKLAHDMFVVGFEDCGNLLQTLSAAK